MLKQSFEYELPIYILHIIIDEDMAGDYLLAEAKFPLNQVLPQMQKKFQICLEKPDLRVSLMLTRYWSPFKVEISGRTSNPK